MSAITRIIIIATILYLHPPLCSTSFLHATVPRLLTIVRRIYLSMDVEDLHGVVVYCVDSERNQFAIEVIEGKDQKRFVQIMYNKRYDTVTLYELCGCYQCEARFVDFMIYQSDTSMCISCNSRGCYSPRLSEIGHQINNTVGVGVGVRYPVPLSIANGGNATFIAIGNIGPMVDEGHRTVAPFIQQIVGCLMYFFCDDEHVEFMEEGSAVRRSCARSCDNGTCNGGRCHSMGLDYGILRRHRILDRYRILHSRPICNCSSTALNGLYCNKALRRYRHDGHNTYTMNEKASLKMSWEVSSPGRYCLLEVVRGGGSMTLVIEGGHLTANSTIISRIDAHNANFLLLDIRYDHYVVKTKYSESNISLSLGADFLVNIGFSEQSADCGTLEGSYDIAMHPGYIRKLRQWNSPPSTGYKWLVILGSGISLLAISVVVHVAHSVIKRRRSNISVNIGDPGVVEVELRLSPSR